MSILDAIACEVRDIFGLSNKPPRAQCAGMKTATAKKHARPLARRATHTSAAARPPKPSKRTIAEAWAKLAGIVNTGETDLSTREGFGD